MELLGHYLLFSAVETKVDFCYEITYHFVRGSLHTIAKLAICYCIRHFGYQSLD